MAFGFTFSDLGRWTNNGGHERTLPMRTRPYHLDLTLAVHTDDAPGTVRSMHRQHWWLILLLALLAVLLIGVGITGGFR